MDIIREPKGIQEFTGACELSGQHVVWREKKKSCTRTPLPSKAATSLPIALPIRTFIARIS